MISWHVYNVLHFWKNSNFVNFYKNKSVNFLVYLQFEQSILHLLRQSVWDKSGTCRLYPLLLKQFFRRLQRHVCTKNIWLIDVFVSLSKIISTMLLWNCQTHRYRSTLFDDSFCIKVWRMTAYATHVIHLWFGTVLYNYNLTL